MKKVSSLFESNRILVCVGAGGVGKTTVAASLGVLSAKAGLKTLVLTVDPSRRLAKAFGLGDSEEQKQIHWEDVCFPQGGEFWVGAICHELFFARFIREGVKDEALLQKLIKNKIYQKLTDTLSGSQDFTSMGRLLEAWESQEFDLIVLDTPPSEHALDFFQAPKKFQRIFDKKLMSWFSQEKDTDRKLPNLLKSLVGFGLQSAQSVLQKLTGSSFMLELTEFFSALSHWQQELSDKTKKVDELLKSSNLKFVVVTGAEEERLEQTEYLKNQLQQEGLSLEVVVVNRIFPSPDSVSREHWPELEKHYSYQKNLCQKLSLDLNGVPVIEVLEMKEDIGSLDGVMIFSELILKNEQEMGL